MAFTHFNTGKKDPTSDSLRFTNCAFEQLADNIQRPSATVFSPGCLFGVTEPLFQDTAVGDYRLLPCSPLINAGDNNVWANPTNPTDFNGAPRIQDGTIDIGPYESPALEQAHAALTTPACGPVPIGSVSFQLKNGCPPYTFNWQNGASTGTDTALLAPGSYFFTITDHIGKTYLDTVAINGSNPTVSILGDEYICAGDPSGVLTATVTGAAGAVQFDWDNGESTQSISNLSEGVYSINIMDGAGCISMDTATIEEAAKSGLNYSINNATGQNKPDGSIVLNLISGLPPFKFLWSNGDTTGNPGGLLPGEYVLSLTNAIGCLDTFHFKVDFIVKIMEKGGEKPAFVQPNPARDWAEIIWGDFDEWHLFNNMGQLAMAHQRGLSGGKIDLTGLPPGIYRYVFVKKDGRETVGKLVVAR